MKDKNEDVVQLDEGEAQGLMQRLRQLKAVAKLREMAARILGGRGRTSRRDLASGVDVVLAKRKLGKAFFTKRQTPRARRAALRQLEPRELALAVSRGWTNVTELRKLGVIQ